MKAHRTHGLRATIAAAGVLAAAGLAALPAQAATGDATVTVVHGIPDTPVDVYVDGNRALANFAFETVTDPISLPAGSHDIEVRPAGAAAGSDPILELSPDLPAGANATVVAHLTAEGEPSIKPFINPTEAVPDGMGRLVVRHTAAAPAVDVLAGGEAVISGLSNPDEKMLMVPEGTVAASVAAAGTTDPVIGPVDLPVQSGQTLVVYAVGSLEDGNLTAVTQSYASGGAAAPNAVDAGTGGQADGGSSAPLLALAALAGVGLVAAGSRRMASAPAKR